MTFNRASAPRCMVLAFLLAVIAPAAPAFADDRPWPRLPCTGDPSPPYPEVDAPARAHAWVGTFEETAWRPPACAGWESRPFKVLVALTGRFRHAADASTLLARFGAISGLRQVLYWSITDRAWLHLTTEADALERPDDQRPRAGFTSDELIARPVSYFRQKDNRLKTTTVYHHNSARCEQKPTSRQHMLHMRTPTLYCNTFFKKGSGPSISPSGFFYWRSFRPTRPAHA